MKGILRTLTLSVLVLSSALSMAQKPDFDAKAKAAVLGEMQTVLTKNAFVPGVDFDKWPTLLATYQDQLDKEPSLYCQATWKHLCSIEILAKLKVTESTTCQIEHH